MSWVEMFMFLVIVGIGAGWFAVKKCGKSNIIKPLEP